MEPMNLIGSFTPNISPILKDKKNQLNIDFVTIMLSKLVNPFLCDNVIYLY